MLTWIVATFAGARRWFNAESAKALAAGIAALVLVGAAALLFSAGASSGGAKKDASWLQRLNAATVSVMRKRAEREKEIRTAVARDLERVEAERDAAIARAAAIASELAKLSDDPVIYPASLAREMNR